MICCASKSKWLDGISKTNDPLKNLMTIPSVLEIRNDFPLRDPSIVENARKKIIDIVQGNSDKIAVLVGPCSIHDSEVAIDYAKRLAELSSKLQNISLVMRLFFEKPRTLLGWKGLIYDPRLNGSYDFSYGLKLARKILSSITALGVASCTELLDPLVVPYFEDLITWGMIGARTSASQPHRQLASGLSFPVGFKNGIHGELDSAIYGILSSRTPHTHLSIDETGKICAKETQGNPFTHLVLRGADTKSNFDENSIQESLSVLISHEIEPKVLIDCSHGNSKKDPKQQPVVFESVIRQISSGQNAIMGLMLESHILAGKQPITSPLSYGLSITDACIGWEETESLLLWGDEMLSSRPTLMSSVQK